jgi:hypothetical protein
MSEKTPIEKLYAEKKAKGFVNHLIQSYLPVDKPKKFWEFKKGQKHKCNVCGQKLFSVSEYLVGVNQKHQEIADDFSDFMRRTLIEGEEVRREDHPIIKHVVGDKVIGWTGEKTDTTLCLSCIKDLLDLTQNGILRGDKNIIWLTKKMQRSRFFSAVQENDNVSENNKEKVKEIHKKVEKNKKVTTFADLGVLQDIKKQMEENN